MKQILGDSWQTSISGYLGAIAIAVIPVLQSGRLPSLQELALAAVVAVLGRFAKDHSA